MKKGFTLIELLGVIVVLGIIGLITVPIVQGVIKESENNLCEDKIETIKRAAKNYASENPYIYSNNDDDDDEQKPKNPTLGDLINGGYLEGDIKPFNTNNKVSISYNNGKYKFEFDGSCQD